MRSLLVCAILAAAPMPHAGTQPTPQAAPQASRTPLAFLPNGIPVFSLASPDIHALVLFFVASDCPVSNRTFPEMVRLRERFSAASVAFWFVYPNATELPATVTAHQQAFDPDGHALLDPNGTLTRMAAAEATPAVALFTGQATAWTRVYTGRVDDRVLRLGVERPHATAHFAERALEELLAGHPIDQPQGHPIGCAIAPPTHTGVKR